jgi:Fanconi anemia group M protein
MAPTRPLVLQHEQTYRSILTFTEEDAVTLTGKTPSAYRKQVWEGNAHIIFATPQVVKNDLETGLLSLKDFSLLVFDECHRARKEYAYTDVARKYVEQASWPIILGMTTSPGADKKKITEICDALFIEQIEYKSEDDPDVSPYVNPIQTEWKYLDLPAEYRNLSQIIRSMLNGRLTQLSRLGIIKGRPEYVGRRDLLEAGEILRYRLEETIEEERGPIYSAIVAQSASLTLFHALELLETQGIPVLTQFLERLERESEEKRSYKTIIDDHHYNELKTLLGQCELPHPKTIQLKTEVDNQLKQNPKSKVLVFTQYRDTASYLVDRLRGTAAISVARFVGQASKQNDPGLSQDEQAEILRDFREGDTNVLVATCIGEEGLDIPSCDLVIFYEPIPSEIRFIQRRGRTGRKAAGKVIILAARGTFDIAYLHASRRRVEKMRQISSTLNQELKTFTRRGPRPEPNPMTVDELKRINNRATTIEAEPQVAAPEEAKAKEFIKMVDKAAKYVWMKAMKAGSQGLLIEDLTEQAVEDSITPATIKAAIDNLQELAQIERTARDRIATVASKQRKDEDTYEVLVEKIYSGKAVVLINDKWRARLTHQDFDGPPNIIKKNARFKATGILFHDGDTLCLRVREVIQLLA